MFSGVTDISSSTQKSEFKQRNKNKRNSLSKNQQYNRKQSNTQHYFDEDLILLEQNLRLQVNMDADIFYTIQEVRSLNLQQNYIPIS